ncbi:hypothetical protein DXG01_004453 [Tephrocybe rancida]|nr:hypothetical protein DXG01_004453 [Tephrocybe rancida]
MMYYPYRATPGIHPSVDHPGARKCTINILKTTSRLWPERPWEQLDITSYRLQYHRQNEITYGPYLNRVAQFDCHLEQEEHLMYQLLTPKSRLQDLESRLGAQPAPFLQTIYSRLKAPSLTLADAQAALSTSERRTLRVRAEHEEQLYLHARLQRAESEVEYLRAEVKDCPEYDNEDACEKNQSRADKDSERVVCEAVIFDSEPRSQSAGDFAANFIQSVKADLDEGNKHNEVAWGTDSGLYVPHI